MSQSLRYTPSVCTVVRNNRQCMEQYGSVNMMSTESELPLSNPIHHSACNAQLE